MKKGDPNSRKPAVPKSAARKSKKSVRKSVDDFQHFGVKPYEKATDLKEIKNVGIIEYAAEALQKAKGTVDEADHLLEQKEFNSLQSSKIREEEKNEILTPTSIQSDHYKQVEEVKQDRKEQQIQYQFA